MQVVTRCVELKVFEWYYTRRVRAPLAPFACDYQYARLLRSISLPWEGSRSTGTAAALPPTPGVNSSIPTASSGGDDPRAGAGSGSVLRRHTYA